jgi:ADP-ribose pyrophosphatase YjhB (NUDIX family)
MTTTPKPRPPRIAVRGILLHEDRLLLVNAWKGHDRLWCAPGGGVEPHASLHDNLRREFLEETGLDVDVGTVCLVNEFHERASDFHQIDIYFRCTLLGGDPHGDWTDPEGIVTYRRWASRAEMPALPCKPDSLAAVAWGEVSLPFYDTLEPLVRG